MAAAPAFQAERVVRSATIELNALPERVFPLFGPYREAEWAEGWEISPVYPSSGQVSKDFVFTTQHQNRPDTIWTVIAYDPSARHIEYLNVTPEFRVGRIHITVEAAKNGTSLASITYSYTALSDKGNDFITTFDEEHFRHNMLMWQRAINHYLATGERLHIPNF